MNGKKILFGAAYDGLLLFLMRAPIKYLRRSGKHPHRELCP